MLITHEAKIIVMAAHKKPLQLKAAPESRRAVAFVQLETRSIAPFDDLIRRAPIAGRLLLRLIGLLQTGAAGVIVVSRQALREMLRVSMPSIDRSLKLLAEEGWLQRMKVGGSFALAINRRIAWVGPRDDLPKAAFDGQLLMASVVLARSEQDAIALDPPPMRTVPAAEVNELVSAVGLADPPAQAILPGCEPIARFSQASADQAERESLEAQGQTRIPDPAPVAHLTTRNIAGPKPVTDLLKGRAPNIAED